jgi:hypothetical protein
MIAKPQPTGMLMPQTPTPFDEQPDRAHQRALQQPEGDEQAENPPERDLAA